MVSEIDEYVDAQLHAFMKSVPLVLEEDSQQQLRRDWLKQHYVKHVATVVERCPKTRWSFKPAVTLEQVSDEMRPLAAQLYSLIDEPSAVKITAFTTSQILLWSCDVPFRACSLWHAWNGSMCLVHPCKVSKQ